MQELELQLLILRTHYHHTFVSFIFGLSCVCVTWSWHNWMHALFSFLQVGSYISLGILNPVLTYPSSVD